MNCLRRTFRIYDDNGSRMLEYEELKNGVKDYGLNMSKAELDELFACFDKDNSGTISFDEFILELRVRLNNIILAYRFFIVPAIITFKRCCWYCSCSSVDLATAWQISASLKLKLLQLATQVRN